MEKRAIVPVFGVRVRGMKRRLACRCCHHSSGFLIAPPQGI
jgi:hypothetical protein